MQVSGTGVTANTDGSVTVPNSAATLTATFSLAAVAKADVTFQVRTLDGSAVKGTNYTAVEKTVTIPTGETSVTAEIPLLKEDNTWTNDNLWSGDKVFYLQANNITGALFAGDTHSLTQAVRIQDTSISADSFLTSVDTYAYDSGSDVDVWTKIPGEYSFEVYHDDEKYFLKHSVTQAKMSWRVPTLGISVGDNRETLMRPATVYYIDTGVDAESRAATEQYHAIRMNGVIQASSHVGYDLQNAELTDVNDFKAWESKVSGFKFLSGSNKDTSLSGELTWDLPQDLSQRSEIAQTIADGEIEAANWIIAYPAMNHNGFHSYSDLGSISASATMYFYDKLPPEVESVTVVKEPFAAVQTLYYGENKYGYSDDVKGRKGKLGPGDTYSDLELETLTLWWGQEKSESGMSLRFEDQFGITPKNQSCQILNYPFTTMPVTIHSWQLNKDTMSGWLDTLEGTGLNMVYTDSQGQQVKREDPGFRIINMLGAGDAADEDNMLRLMRETALKSTSNGEGRIDVANALVSTGIALATTYNIGTDMDMLTMKIVPTADPTVFRGIFLAGINNMIDDNVTGIDPDTSQKDDLDYMPGFADLKNIASMGASGWATDAKNRTENAQKLLKNHATIRNRENNISYMLKGGFETEIYYDYDAGAWKMVVVTGQLNVSGGFGMSWNFNSFCGPVPVTAQLAFGVALDVQFAAAVDRTQMANDYLTQVQLNAFIRAFGGIGFDYAILAMKIGLFGQLSFQGAVRFLNAIGEAQAKVGYKIDFLGEVGIEFLIKFLFITYERVLWSQKIQIPSIQDNNWDAIDAYWEEVQQVNSGNEYEIITPGETQHASLTASQQPELLAADSSTGVALYGAPSTATLESRDYLESPRTYGGSLQVLRARAQTLAENTTSTGYQELIGNTVTATFGSGTTARAAASTGTINLNVPNLGVSTFETVQQEDGKRVLRFSLYNKSAAQLENSGRTVKVGLFSDPECTMPIESQYASFSAVSTGTRANGAEFTIDSTTDLAAIDQGAYAGQITMDLAAYAKSDPKNYMENGEIRSGGVTVDVTFIPEDWPFVDVTEDKWYYDAVAYVYQQGIMVGMSETTFEPNTTVNRAQVVQMLYNLEGQPQVSGDSGFSDIRDDQWYAKAVAWASANDVVAGYEDGTFRPTRAVTREEFAQILYNYAKFKGYGLSASADLGKFPDSGQVSSWAETALGWPMATGLSTATTTAGWTPRAAPSAPRRPAS
ncbi:MAG: S-layer homology domain-containing protein [Acutalibacter sp.]